MAARAYSRFDLPRDQAAWMEYARCGGGAVDPEIFFYNETSAHPDDVAKKKQARTFCTPCPVRLACLAYGQVRREHGHWGGFGPHARSLRRSLR